MSDAHAAFQRVQTVLAAIQDEQGATIAFAAESGSRAWHFESPDSDYDARFVYVRPARDYLGVSRPRDVIEPGVRDDDIEPSGWDIAKALALFARSNPGILEWLHSPVLYIDRFGLRDALRALLATYYQPLPSLYHYHHMAEGNWNAYLQGERIKLKKYLYVLRPILACRYIEQTGEFPPVQFGLLTTANTGLSDALRAAIADLVTLKQSREEIGAIGRIPVIHSFLEQEIVRLARLLPRRDGQPRQAMDAKWPTVPVPTALLDALMRATIVQAYGATID